MGKKGKTPKGRAGAKKKAQKGGGGSGNSSPWQNNFVRASNGRPALDDDEDAYDYKGFRGFAQNNNSPRNFTPQASAVKLRHQAISFVAAGTNTPPEFDISKPSPNEAALAAADDSDDDVLDLEETVEDVEDTTLHTNIAVDTDLEASEGGIAQMSLHSSGAISEQDTGPTSSDVDMVEKTEVKQDVDIEHELFVVDTAGDETLAPPASRSNGKKPVKRAPSPTPSESSDDEVVFAGRGKPRTIEDPVRPNVQSGSATTQSKKHQQTSSEPPRSDPLAARNNAARTLPQEYQMQTCTPVTKGTAPRDDTIKETFKKTSGSQDILGGPRKYDSTEHIVHDAGGSRPADPVSSSEQPEQQGAVNLEEPHVADDLLHALSAPPANDDAWLASAPVARGWGTSPSKADREVNPEATWAPAPAGSWWKKPKKQPRPDLDMSAEEKAAIDASPPKVTKISFAEPGSSKQGGVETAPTPTEDGDGGEKESVAALKADLNQKLRDKRRAKRSAREADTIPLENPKSAAGSSSRRRRGARKKDNRTLRAAIDSEDDDDAAGEAAYDDYMANLAAQMESEDMDAGMISSFARSSGLGGPSMMVDGQAIGENETLKKHPEMTNGDEDEWESDSDEPIGQDVSDLSSDERLNYDEISDYSDDEGSVKSSELEDELEYTEREMWEDEEDLRERRKQAMTDEQIAHLLAKQQEFGYDGDDLVLDNGMGMDGVGDVDEARLGLANMTNIVAGSRKNKGSRRSGGRKGLSFPDASALADSVDQYGDAGFDIMDFDRPSLRPTKKGRKGKLPAELEAISDDEMKENMSAAWENDREKKRLKKAEREELRTQGMLGSAGKKGKADLTEKYKYQDGMSPAQILDELRAFLQDDGQQSRPFPPMDKHNRKRLHEVANTLNLKSKSVGAGKSRFPVLYKTSRTLAFDERLFRETFSASNREGLALNVKFAKRAKRMANKGPGAKGRGGGGGMAAASVSHGEIVGANAPEIGVENRGFKFMQKMGWTPGMSLGREGEGRLVPVEQMMRVGRAGLG